MMSIFKLATLAIAATSFRTTTAQSVCTCSLAIGGTVSEASCAIRIPEAVARCEATCPEDAPRICSIAKQSCPDIDCTPDPDTPTDPEPPTSCDCDIQVAGDLSEVRCSTFVQAAVDRCKVSCPAKAGAVCANLLDSCPNLQCGASAEPDTPPSPEPPAEPESPTSCDCDIQVAGDLSEVRCSTFVQAAVDRCKVSCPAKAGAVCANLLDSCPNLQCGASAEPGTPSPTEPETPPADCLAQCGRLDLMALFLAGGDDLCTDIQSAVDEAFACRASCGAGASFCQGLSITSSRCPSGFMCNGSKLGFQTSSTDSGLGFEDPIDGSVSASWRIAGAASSAALVAMAAVAN